MTELNDPGKCCPTCKRPWKKLTNTQRARSGDYPGQEKEAAKSLGNLAPTCKRIHEFLVSRAERYPASHPEGWVSSQELRNHINGDGPRRARQLRDEYGVPVETRMETRDGRTLAYYRISNPGYLSQVDVNVEEPYDLTKGTLWVIETT